MRKNRSLLPVAVGVLVLLTALSSCGSPAKESGAEDGSNAELTGDEGETGEASDSRSFEDLLEETEGEVVDPRQESGSDGEVDFVAQYDIRPGISGWITVPGTDIDCPVYTEAPSDGACLSAGADPDMMDFNCVIQAPAAMEDDAFADLYRFADPGFFDDIGIVTYIQPYGTMTYVVLAAYETDEFDLLIPSDRDEEVKKAFIEELRSPAIGKNLRDDAAAGATTGNFYLTLVADRGKGSGKQLIVVAMLAGIE